MTILEINIGSKSKIMNYILIYSAFLSKNDNFDCDEIIKSFGKYVMDLKICLGITKINYKNNELTINYYTEGKPVGTYFNVEKMTFLKISTPYTNENDRLEKIKLIDDFIFDSKEFVEKRSDNEITLKLLTCSGWSCISKIPKRSLDTVFLPQKEEIFNDMLKFMNNEKFYNERGIAYKRNYLFEGIPGTGKTSLIFALASHFNLNIFMINFGPKIDDYNFMSAINNLPNNSILLLEDIDCLFNERECVKTCVSFSAVLNVLDGVARKNGLITFMTTNYLEKLDKALIRAGRVDMLKSFGYCKYNEFQKMILIFVPEQKNNIDTLWNKINHLEFTTSQLEKFLKNYCLNHTDNICNYYKDFIDIVKETSFNSNSIMFS